MKIRKIRISIFLLVLSLNSFTQTHKVMTYNIRLYIVVDGENDWAHRKGFITSQIKFYEPYFLGEQEPKPSQVIVIDSAFTSYSQIGMAREGVGKGESSNIAVNKYAVLSDSDTLKYPSNHSPVYMELKII